MLYLLKIVNRLLNFLEYPRLPIEVRVADAHLARGSLVELGILYFQQSAIDVVPNDHLASACVPFRIIVFAFYRKHQVCCIVYPRLLEIPNVNVFHLGREIQTRANISQFEKIGVWFLNFKPLLIFVIVLEFG
jgi:hypothetical protein